MKMIWSPSMKLFQNKFSFFFSPSSTTPLRNSKIRLNFLLSIFNLKFLPHHHHHNHLAFRWSLSLLAGQPPSQCWVDALRIWLRLWGGSLYFFNSQFADAYTPAWRNVLHNPGNHSNCSIFKFRKMFNRQNFRISGNRMEWKRERAMLL